MAATGNAEAIPERADAVLSYWFGPAYKTAGKDFFPGDKMGLWFRGGREIDEHITTNFGADLEAMGRGEYDAWRDIGPLSLLAGVVIADQFSRNVHRGTPKAFALDPKSLSWALHAMDTGAYEAVPHIMRLFLLLPLEHSEALADQERCVDMNRKELEQLAGHPVLAGPYANFLQYAEAHRNVIKTWGRFPHRNAILGRENTPEEAAGLADGSIAKF